MSAKNFLTIGCVIIFLLSGCQSHHNSTDGIELSHNKIIIDSITKLDSLTIYYRVRNVSLAVFYAKRALTLARNVNSPSAMIKANKAMGNSYSTHYQDSSFYYYNQALNLAEYNKMSNEIPILFYNIAIIYINVLNYQAAMKLLDSCINISIKTKNYAVLSKAYNSMGLIHKEIKDICVAKIFFERALHISQEHGLPSQIATALCNLAAFEKDTKNAITEQKGAIHQLIHHPNTEEELAETYNLIGSEETIPDSAISYYKSALMIANARNMPLIEISTYNNLTYSYLDKGDIKKADECIMDLALPLAKKLNNYDWLSTLYDTYADVLAKKGDFNGAFNAVRESVEIRSKFEFSKNEAQIRLLSAILDLKNKELTIRENVSEIKEKSKQNQVLRLVILVFFLLFVLTVFLFIGFRQRTHLKIKQQQILSASRIIEMEETEKSRIGFELHDNIGYLVRGIDGFIKSMEIKDLKIKQELKEKMTELSECIRRISHRMTMVKDDKSTFHEMVADIINDMINLTGISVKYFIPVHLPVFSKETELHVCRVIQELLTNAAKHAHESKIGIDLAFTDNLLILMYNDNGPGFESSKTDQNGIGLKSITERIALLNGKVKLQTAPGKGTKWEITIPFKG